MLSGRDDLRVTGLLLADFQLLPGRLVKEHPEALPETGGVYAIFMQRGEGEVNRHLLDQVGAVNMFAAWPVLYIGATEDSLRARLKCHYVRDSRASTFRRSVGLLAQAPLGLRVQQLAGSRAFCFENEQPLSDWLGAETLIAIAACADPFTIEGQLLAAAPGLVNLAGRPDNPVSLRLRERRAAASGL